MEKTKFAGTFLSDNIENNKRLFYAWNEYSPNKIFGSNGQMLGMYMRVKILDRVYFVTDNETVDAFLNASPFLKSSFFITEDIDATDIPELVIARYFEMIS